MPSTLGVKSPILRCRENPLASGVSARTPNRLRWASREYSGDRENSGQGTRQSNPVTSEEGMPLLVSPLRDELAAVAVTRPKRLFTKNTGGCEAVRRCIPTDACPVPER